MQLQEMLFVILVYADTIRALLRILTLTDATTREYT